MKKSEFGKTEIKDHIKGLEKQIRRRYDDDGKHRRTIRELKGLKSFIKSNATKKSTTDKYPTNEFLSKLRDVKQQIERRARYDGKNHSIIEHYVEPLETKIKERAKE